ncbi:hypothetical protein [Fundidesulfovibrio soli]|uniref:hypothetical protein n=1 Tax=Fundidesulfovibrio soli TaxID=2922716 RepID=UPI001FAF5B02|nr:hypothetical protein [Fundidesulfovibrio soli]
MKRSTVLLLSGPLLSALFALLALLAAPAGHPARAAEPLTAAEDGSYSLNLPADFVRIPPLELFLFKHPSKQAPVPHEELAAFRRTHAGFQKKAETWFATPFMLITRESGKKRTPQELFMDHVLAERDRENASPSGAVFLEKEYFPTRRMHYYKEAGFNRTLGGQVVSATYTWLTADGFLRLTWYITGEQRPLYEEALHQAALSLALSPQAAHK